MEIFRKGGKGGYMRCGWLKHGALPRRTNIMSFFFRWLGCEWEFLDDTLAWEDHHQL